MSLHILTAHVGLDRKPGHYLQFVSKVSVEVSKNKESKGNLGNTIFNSDNKQYFEMGATFTGMYS